MFEKPSKTLIVLGVLVTVIVIMSEKNGSAPDRKSAATTTGPTIESIAARQAEERRFDFVRDATAVVRAAMRDPESLKWEVVLVNDDATVACLQYRAKNGFGGTNRESAVIFNNAASKKAADIKKYCNQPMNDQIAAAR